MIKDGKFSITKTVEFCGAHKLEWHDGACQNLHGHLWRVSVTVVRRELERVGHLDENDIVYDLGKLGKILRELAEALDHSYLNDTFKNPTAERIAAHFFVKTTYLLPNGIDVERVVVEESPGSQVTLEC